MQQKNFLEVPPPMKIDEFQQTCNIVIGNGNDDKTVTQINACNAHCLG